jgi:hypothetical protein
MKGMGSACVLDDLRDLLDRLARLDVASVDPTDLDNDDLHALMVSVQTQRSRLALAAADVLHEWEQRGTWRADRHLRAAVGLSQATRSCDRVAGFELRRAKVLQRFGLVRAALAAGRVSMDQVDLFVRAATEQRLEWFLAHEAEFLAQIEGAKVFADVRGIIRAWEYRADDEIGIAHQRPAPSRLYASRHGVTGESFWDGHFNAVDSEIVLAELSRLAKELRQEDMKAGVTRTAAQLRAAAMVRMASRSINATGMTARPLLQIIAGDLAARHMCQLQSGHVVHPQDLAEYIDAAVMETFLFDGPMVVMAKTNQRLFRGALRKAILVRDRRCQHEAGCPTPASECDVDHRTPAARGGPTSQFNGRAECTPHNRNDELQDDAEALPERDITYLDAVRARLRFQMLLEEAG